MRYDGSTALVVVDVQNDFADPAGRLYVREGETVVPIANDQIARSDGGRCLRRLHPGLASGARRPTSRRTVGCGRSTA